MFCLDEEQNFSSVQSYLSPCSSGPGMLIGKLLNSQQNSIKWKRVTRQKQYNVGGIGRRDRHDMLSTGVKPNRPHITRYIPGFLPKVRLISLHLAHTHRLSQPCLIYGFCSSRCTRKIPTTRHQPNNHNHGYSKTMKYQGWNAFWRSFGSLISSITLCTSPELQFALLSTHLVLSSYMVILALGPYIYDNLICRRYWDKDECRSQRDTASYYSGWLLFLYFVRIRYLNWVWKRKQEAEMASAASS